MTQVVLLGTGAGDGWPNAFCRCTSCETARSRNELRSPTSALVDDVILLDCGPETARAASRAGRTLEQVHTMLITHAHPDHCDPSVLLWRAWAGLRAPLTVVGPRAVLDLCQHWVGPNDPVTFREVTPGERLTCGDHEVRVLEANHVPGAVLYDVTGPDRARLLYATDTGALPESTVSACTDAAFDLVLLEETFGDAGQLGTDHHGLAAFGESVGRLRRVGAVTETTTVAAIHLGHHNPPEPELTRRLTEHGGRAFLDLTVLDLSAGKDAIQRAGEPSARRVLVTGGARSGKSAAAEALVGGGPVTYVATAPAYDDDPDWHERVAAHRARRPHHWTTVELDDPADLTTVIAKASADDVLLVDCMTLWLTRVIDARAAWDAPERRTEVADDVDDLVAAWIGAAAAVVMVTNEVGSGIVPATESGRFLRDQLGSLNARLAAHADEVRLVVAGRSVRLP